MSGISIDEGKTSFRPGPLLVDYVAIFGHAEESFESKKAKELLSDPTCKLEGAVLSRVPEKDHSHQPFPPGVSMFVFPSGILMKPTKEKRSFHSFVLTMASGTRMYGYCCTVYQPLDAKKMAIVRMQIAAKLMAMPNPNLDDYQLPSQLYVPKSVCVLSVFPFLQRTMRLLKQICARQIHSEEDLSAKLANNIYQLLKCPGPVQGQPPVHLTISRSYTEFCFPPLTKPPLADLDYDILFSRLEPMNLITLLNCVLLELPVLVISCHVEILTPALEALISLMYPFTWNYIYIPLLPSCLNDVFAAPQSYLIGTLTETLNDPPWPSNAVIVDLDNNDVSVNVHGIHTFTPLPWRLSWRLYASITKHYNIFYERHPQTRINFPKELPPFCQVVDVAQENPPVENIFGGSHIPIITLDTANVLASGLDESSEDLSEEESGKSAESESLSQGLSIRTISDDGAERKSKFKTRAKPLPPSTKRPDKKQYNPDSNLLVEEDGTQSPLKTPSVNQRNGQFEDIEIEKKTLESEQQPQESGVLKDSNTVSGKDTINSQAGIDPHENGKGSTKVVSLERLRSFSESSKDMPLRLGFLSETNLKTKSDLPSELQYSKKRLDNVMIYDEETSEDTFEKSLQKNKDSELTKVIRSSMTSTTTVTLTQKVLAESTKDKELPSLSRSSSRSSEDSFIEVPSDPQESEVLKELEPTSRLRSRSKKRHNKDSGASAEPEIFEIEDVDGRHPRSAPAVMLLSPERLDEAELDESARGEDEEIDPELDKILNTKKVVTKNSLRTKTSSSPISIPITSEQAVLRAHRRSGEEKKKAKDILAVRKSFLSVFISLFKTYDQWIRARDVSVFSHRSPPRSTTKVGGKSGESVSSTPTRKGEDQELKNVIADVTPQKPGLSAEAKEAIRDLDDPPFDQSLSIIPKKFEDDSSIDRFFLHRDRVDSTFTRTEFDERGFQSQFENKADKLFVQRIIESQMFQVFIQQRMTRLYVGANPDWFDVSVTKTLQRRQLNRFKRGRYLKCGILYKQGSVIPNWRPRFFVLDGLTLTYYKPSYGEQIASKDKKLRRLLIYERSGRCPPSKMADVKRQIDQERTNLEKLKASLAKGVLELIPGQTKVGVPDTPGRLYKTGYVFEIVVSSHRLISCTETSRERDLWIEAILARTTKAPTLPNDLAYLYRKTESEILAATVQLLQKCKSRTISDQSRRSTGSNSTISTPVGSQCDTLDQSGKTPPSSSPRKSTSLTRPTPRRNVGGFKSPASYSPTNPSPTKLRPEHIRGRFGTVI